MITILIVLLVWGVVAFILSLAVSRVFASQPGDLTTTEFDGGADLEEE